MVNLDEERFLTNEIAAVGMQKSVEEIEDEICEDGFSNIIMLGTGGSYSDAIIMEYIINRFSDISFYALKAIDFNLDCFLKVNKESVVIIKSASGSNPELALAAEKCKKIGCKIIGMINNPESELAEVSDYLISCPVGNYYKLYYLIFRFMYQNKEFLEYTEMTTELRNMPKAKLNIKKEYDKQAKKLAKKLSNLDNIYIVGGGILWGQIFAYSMYTMEERLWKKSKSVHCSDFLYGTLEVIDKNSTVLLIKADDETRIMMGKIELLLNRICENVFVIDLKQCEMPDTMKKFSEIWEPFLLDTVFERLNTHLEIECRHPLDVRRYRGNLEI